MNFILNEFLYISKITFCKFKLTLINKNLDFDLLKFQISEISGN